MKAVAQAIEQVDAVRELERMEAARHVERARNVDELLPYLSPLERTRQAQAWRSIAAVLTSAAAKAEREQAFTEIPELIREGSVLPLTREQDRG